jgi:hypothetical protein
VIEHLKKRGKLVLKNKFKHAEKIDEKNYALLKDNIDEIGVPVKAFIIFMDQEHKERC